MTASSEQRAALRLDVFRTTGLKVDEDDPIMLCALMQSKLMRDAGIDVALHLEQSVAGSIESLERMLDRKVDEVAAAIALHARASVEKLADEEVSRLSSRLSRAAKSLRETLPAEDPEEHRWRKRVVGILVIAITASSLSAASLFGGLTEMEREYLKFGQQVSRALPKMDGKTRKALLDAIQSSE